MLSIELHTAEEIRTGVRVFYSVIDEHGTADVKTVIPYDSLETFICDNGLNIESFTNWKHVNLECDGYDERTISAEDYLTGNLNEVVLAYLTENLKEVA